MHVRQANWRGFQALSSAETQRVLNLKRNVNPVMMIMMSNERCRKGPAPRPTRGVSSYLHIYNENQKLGTTFRSGVIYLFTEHIDQFGSIHPVCSDVGLETCECVIQMERSFYFQNNTYHLNVRKDVMKNKNICVEIKRLDFFKITGKIERWENYSKLVS